MERLTCKLLGLGPRRVYTDGLKVYPSLIPHEVHRVGKWLILPIRRISALRIERKNLTHLGGLSALRVNLKRLARKTLASCVFLAYSFTRSVVMLEACLARFLSAFGMTSFGDEVVCRVRLSMEKPAFGGLHFKNLAYVSASYGCGCRRA